MDLDSAVIGTEKTAANGVCPRLRPGLAAAQDPGDPHYVFLWDQLRVARTPQRLNLLEFMWLQMFNGERTLRDIQAESMRRLQGQLLPLEWIQALAERLESQLYLDGPLFREKLAGPVREPACLGTYQTNVDLLRQQLADLFTGPRGPGLPGDVAPDGALRAALVPHIDYQRGGATFAWGFREIVERTDASLFVIIGTAHYSPARFTLTRQNFKTPLGIVPTDQDYIERLVSCYGQGLFDDPFAHLPEHSIELEVVLLQYLYENRRPIRIVPLVVGSFQDCIQMGGMAPRSRLDIGRMIDGLERVEAQVGEPICYVISGDLAHLGPKFGDPDPLAEPTLARSREQDQALLHAAEQADAAAYFQIIASEGDRRRICGLPPTYTVLEAIKPGRGRLLHYDQYVHPGGHESVSFASMAFYR
jgi:AmmeMemoRadiSam system protein B